MKKQIISADPLPGRSCKKMKKSFIKEKYYGTAEGIRRD